MALHVALHNDYGKAKWIPHTNKCFLFSNNSLFHFSFWGGGGGGASENKSRSALRLDEMYVRPRTDYLHVIHDI